MQPFRLVAPWFVLLGSLAAPAVAQCDPAWNAANPPPQLRGTASCSTLWDPDGAGPATPRLVVGGASLDGGTMAADSRIGVWDGIRWTGLGSGPGLTGTVRALTVWNGSLIAGGDFSGGGVSSIALWDGTVWQPIGSGIPAVVGHLAVFNGNLVAAGNISGLPFVLTWNGTAWNGLPSAPSLVAIHAMTVYQGLLCVAGGTSSSVVGVLERWNGTSWAPSITTAGANSAIRCLAVRASLAIGGTDLLYVGGNFTSIGGVAAIGLASTPGGGAFAWSPVGSNTVQDCRSLHARSNGLTGFTVVASFPNHATPSTFRYTNTSPWTPIGPPMSSLTLFGGSYHGANALPAGAWHRYDGTAWVPVMGPGLLGEVRAVVAFGSDVVVGGAIQSSTAAALDRIARWDGATFQPLGTGIQGTSVDALCRLDDGSLVAGGLFTAAGGSPANHIARWDGAAWASVGGGTNLQVLALGQLPNGDLVAGGRFTTAGGMGCNRIARWNGSAWAPLGAGFNGDVFAVAVRADGMLCAAGAFTASGATPCSRIAQWNGTSWQPLGTGCDADVHALASRPNGELVAVGAFTSAGGALADRCAVWNGTAWSSTGSGSPDPDPARSVCVLPDGDVVAGRGFVTVALPPDTGIARWDGSTWSGFGSGLAAATTGAAVDVRAIAQRADGTLVVGGTFGFAGGIPALGLATLTPTCPPSVASYGTGCSSTAGLLAIAADVLPWIGSTFRTTTTGVAPGSLCLGAIGFAPTSIPLATLLPEGQPGCSLLASPDLVLTLAPTSGSTAQSQLALPNATTLVGATFVQQTIPLEFGASGLAAVRASNGLSMTIGVL